MKILILNAGSSSLKYQLIDMDNESIIAKGLIDRIGINGSLIKQTSSRGEFFKESSMQNHVEGINFMLEALMDDEKGVLRSMDEIGAVGHRVVHGGEKFSGSVLINDEVIAAIEENIPLGPLHNPANLMGIKASKEIMPDTPNVAVFDTAFHQTIPAKAYMYGAPYEYYEKYRLRRYGFHGTSHGYVSRRAAEFLGVPEKGLKLIVCHLGNGSSISAVKDGKCVDTSMGLTPLEGVLMGTRSGSLDPGALGFLVDNSHLTIHEIIEVLNKQSGLLGISGQYSDMRDIDAACDGGDKRAILARTMLDYSIKKYIGAYAAAMGGVDGIVFTAGIGENNQYLRARVMDGFEFLGAKLDLEKNQTREESVISSDESRVKIMVIPTNEEIVIARDTLALIEEEI